MRQSNRRRSAAPVGGLVLCLAASACGTGPPEGVRPIETVREVELLPRFQPRRATTAQRFGFQPPPPVAGVPADAGLEYELPEGWEELAPTSMRVLNLRVAGDERAECSLTSLPGKAGGLAANVNRWRKQMSLPPLDDAALEALPRAPLMGLEAHLVDMTGTFTAGDEPRPGWRLVGLLAFDASGAHFLKMTGPSDVLERELGRFLALARSLKRGETAPASSAARPRTAPSAAGLTWKLPEGWRRGPDRPMRVANFVVGDDEPVECYVTFLGGTGGGVLANVNRWRRQLGQDPVTADVLDGYPRLAMLGDEGLLVEIEGTLAGSPAMMLGAICLLEDRAVFVKMTGPSRTVSAERDAFVAFCESLELQGQGGN